MNEQIKINWYRCKVDKKVMSELMKTSNAAASATVVPQLLLFVFTTAVTYLAYANIHASNWWWSVPLMLAALWLHGTFASFLGMGGPVHELCHKTPFRTKWLNEFVLQVYSFLSWSDYISFRASHVKHHQVTVHTEHDGEVVLPSKFDGESLKFFFNNFICDPVSVYKRVRDWVWAAFGPEETRLKNWPDWIKLKVMPISNIAMRRQQRRWLQVVLLGHLALAAIFIASGHWFLILLVDCAGFYAGWGTMVVGMPQHIGLSSNVPDHRLCCRTYTCGWVPAFFYWNMQYHIEHHMFPAVPFYNLPKLHEAVKHDMPPATHGLWKVWKEIMPIVRRQRVETDYVFVPPLPANAGDVAGDEILQQEAAQMA
jgi:fatty acid desaturase